MIAETAEIAGTDVSSIEFLAMIGLIVLQHEVGMEYTGTTFFIMKSFPIVHHRWRDDDLVKNLPVGLMLQGAFKAQAIVLPEQVDKSTFFSLGRMPCPQHIVDARVSGTVVHVAHHDDFRLITFRS